MRKKHHSISPDAAFEAFNEAIERIDITARDVAVPPVLFICGAPRSGTTYLYQLLSYYCDVGYVNNLIARFAANPVLGVRLSQALNMNKVFTGRSDYGRTEHLSEPHEFGLGWSRLLGVQGLLQPSTPVDPKAAERIATVARAFEKPLVVKSFAYLWFIEDLAKALPGSLWLNITRDPSDAATSLSGLYAKRGGADDSSAWVSAVLRTTVERHSGKPVLARCRHQIDDLQSHIVDAFSALPPERKLDVSFTDLTTRRRDTLDTIMAHFALPSDPDAVLPSSLEDLQ